MKCSYIADGSVKCYKTFKLSLAISYKVVYTPTLFPEIPLENKGAKNIYLPKKMYRNIYRSFIYSLPAGSDNKESACNAGDLGSIPGLGRCPGEGNGYPLQYSCLENSTDRGTWQATVHGVAKSRTWLSDLHLYVTLRWNKCLKTWYLMKPDISSTSSSVL